MGHISGLSELGPEAMAVQNLPVWASSTLLSLLQQMPLWSPLLQNLQLCKIRPFESIVLAEDLLITPIPVPHRDEIQTGTFAYKMQGPGRTLLYLPDIDDWQQWPEAEEVLTAVDYALVDASFYRKTESPAIHPPVSDTLSRFAHIPGRLVLTHLNHTNPLLTHNSPERQSVQEANAELAYTGQIFHL